MTWLKDALGAHCHQRPPQCQVLQPGSLLCAAAGCSPAQTPWTQPPRVGAPLTPLLCFHPTAPGHRSLLASSAMPKAGEPGQRTWGGILGSGVEAWDHGRQHLCGMKPLSLPLFPRSWRALVMGREAPRAQPWQQHGSCARALRALPGPPCRGHRGRDRGGHWGGGKDCTSGGMQGVTSSSFYQARAPLLSASREGRAASLPEVVPCHTVVPMPGGGVGGAVCAPGRAGSVSPTWLSGHGRPVTVPVGSCWSCVPVTDPLLMPARCPSAHPALQSCLHLCRAGCVHPRNSCREQAKPWDHSGWCSTVDVARRDKAGDNTVPGGASLGLF